MSTATKKPKKKLSQSKRVIKKPAAAEATMSPSSKVAARVPRKGKAAQAKKLSALDAAAKVLAETGTAMTTRALVEAMAEKGYWTSPGGPHRNVNAPRTSSSSV